jgi:hypothetical protein
MPATWMSPRNRSDPGPVSTAAPRGSTPYWRSSLNGARPASFRIAFETPWGMSSHHGKMLRFQDGGPTHNSPAALLPQQAPEIWPPTIRGSAGCLIACGIRPIWGGHPPASSGYTRGITVRCCTSGPLTLTAAVYSGGDGQRPGERRDRFSPLRQSLRTSASLQYPRAAARKAGSTVHKRNLCKKFLRQSRVEWAGQTIPKPFWAGAYYRQQRTKGASHHVAIRALAFKWIRVLFRCWQDRKSYNESIYLSALKRSGSPLLAFIAKDSLPG